MSEKNIIIICGVICATLLIAGILFWPTLYRYEKINFGDKQSGQYLVRVNRLTGYTEILRGYNGWRAVRSKKVIKAMTLEEIAKIAVKGVFNGKGNYEFAVYNGSGWTIKRIKLSIRADAECKKNLWQRVYETSIHVPQFSMSTSFIKLIDETPGTPASWLFNPENYELVGPIKEKAPKEKKQGEVEYIGPIRFVPEVRIEEVFGYKGE